MFDRGYPSPPDTFAVRLGDAIHNYRCVLDHIAWQLVAHGSEPNPRAPHFVQFPFYDYPKTFADNLARRLPGVGSGPIKFIESRQAGPGWRVGRNALTTLAQLSNDDKHKSIHTIVAALSKAEITPYPVDCVIVGGGAPVRSPVAKAGAVIVMFDIEITGPKPDVGVDLELTPYIALDDRRSVLDTLADIRREVSEVFAAPEITSAVS